MSNTQFAFLKKEKVPNRKKWQASINNLKFDVSLEIYPELEPFEDEGFSPCIWNKTEEDVGFEIFYEPSEDIHDGDEELKNLIGENDYCISMVWHSSMKDCAAVMIASCALQKEFGAVISYEGEAPVSFDDLVNSTIETIKLAEEEE